MSLATSSQKPLCRTLKAMTSNNIHIRQYRPVDFPQIRALFVASRGFHEAPQHPASALTTVQEDSIAVVAQRRFLFKTPSLIAYLMCAVGLGVLSRAGRWTSLETGTGILLCAAGLALFTSIQRGIRRTMTANCEKALATDMRDISVYYRAPSGFFVAVKPRSSEEHATDEEEVVGFVGFDYLPEKDRLTAEVRRVVVSAKHRRRGIGTRLMHAVLANAETIPDLRWIELSTSEVQLASQRLYERLGWEMYRIDTLWAGIAGLQIRYFRRPVRTECVQRKHILNSRATFSPSDREVFSG